nr:EOG090X0A8N [Artemia franciscana]
MVKSGKTTLSSQFVQLPDTPNTFIVLARISEVEKVTSGNKKIDQVGSFTYLGSIISKDGGSSEDVKSRIAKARESWTQYSTLWYSAHYFGLVSLNWLIICSKYMNFLLAICKKFHYPVYNSLIDAESRYFGVQSSVLLSPEQWPGIDDEKRKHNDLLVLGNIEDTYELLTSKTLGAFSSILENTSFEYLLKCDDDSYVFIDKLINLLAKQPSKKLYLGYFKGNAHVQRKGAWKEKDWNLCDRYLPYAQGGGYLLSKDLVEYIVKNSDLLKKYKSEDVSVGAWLAPLDINKVHDIRFNTEWRSRGCSNSDVITHKQSPTMMLKMFQNLNAIGYPCSTEIKERQAYEYNWTVLPSHCCNNFI